MARFAFALAALAALARPVVVRAECVEATPSVGVVLRDCAEGGLHWVEVRADLVAADVGVRVTRPGERGQTVAAWAEAVPGAVLAVQGGPFAFPSYAPLGLTVGDGEPWSDAHDDARLGVLAFDERGAGLVAAAEQIVPAEGWMRDTVSGVPVVRDGAVLSPCGGDGCDARPRTALGLGDGGRTLVVIAVEGWTAASAGVTDPELGELAREAGADDALRTGDGATSLVWTRGGALAVPSSDGAPRTTSAFLAVVDRASGVEARIRGVVKQALDPMDVLPGARIRVETTDGRLVVESGTMTTGAYFEHTVPAREYFVKASHAGYRTACKYCPVSGGGELWCSLFLSEGEGEEPCDAPTWGVDAGPWPTSTADGGAPDAGRRSDGGRSPGVDSGCAIGGRSGGAAPILVAAALLLLLLKRR